MLDRLSLLPLDEKRASFASLLSFASSHPREGCWHGADIASASDRLFEGKRIPCPVAVFMSSFILFTSSIVLLGLYIALLPPSFQMAFLLPSFSCLRFFSSGLARFIVGSLSGVRFLHFF